MRVLHVINSLSTGGTETVLYRLVTYPTGSEHEVICLEGPDFYSDKLREKGLTVQHLDWSSKGAASAIWNLQKMVRRSNADVIQSWLYRSNLLAGIMARLAGKSVVSNIRCSSLETVRPGTRWLARIGGMIARWTPDHVINCSSRSAEIHAKLGYGAAPGTIIPNGYDPEDFKPDPAAREATRVELEIEPGTFVIGCIARWHEQKGFPVLFRAVALLRERGVPVRLALIGRGLDLGNQELATLLKESGCSEAVQLVGERGDITQIARALDLHVLASIGSEGFPNVVAESMLSGTPNVVTDVGDGPLIVGDTGWVVPPGDPVALAHAMAAAYDERSGSPEAWAERRNRSRQRIASNYTLERMAEAYLHVWKSVAGNRGRRVRAT